MDKNRKGKNGSNRPAPKVSPAKKRGTARPKAPAKKIKAKTKSKVKRKAGNNWFRIAGYIIFGITVSLLLSLLFYLLFLFPTRLNGRIRSELISIYSPIVYDESEKLLILKLAERPPFALQDEAYSKIREDYGLELRFEKIFSRKNKGINRLTIYKGGEQVQDTGEIYIYWDREIERTTMISLNKERKESLVKREESAPLEKREVEVKREKSAPIKRSEKKESTDYEQIEEKRRSEKKDRVVKHSTFKVVPNRSKEKPFYSEAIRIAIVIDDVGYSYNSTYDFLTLGFPVTFALIPGVEESDKFYDVISRAGYDLMLHLPMEPEKGREYVENHAILTGMSESEVAVRLRSFLERYPAVIGVNNHMGSKAVSDARVMNTIIGELSRHNKFWLDSMTTLETVSKEMASLHHVEYFERDAFLDNKKDVASIRASMERLIKEARQRGYGIGIGHIQTANLALVLKEYYSRRHELGIEFVPLRELKR